MAKITNEFMPENGMMRVPMSAFDDIMKKGFSWIRLPDGTMRKITSKDVLISEADIREIERKWRSGEVPLPDGITLPPERNK